MTRSNHDKTEKRPEKIIPWRRHHLRLDVAESSYHTGEDADAVDVALIFNRAVMKKTILSCPLAVAEEEEINPQNQKSWHGETITLKTRFTRKIY